VLVCYQLVYSNVVNSVKNTAWVLLPWFNSVKITPVCLLNKPQNYYLVLLL